MGGTRLVNFVGTESRPGRGVGDGELLFGGFASSGDGWHNNVNGFNTTLNCLRCQIYVTHILPQLKKKERKKPRVRG